MLKRSTTIILTLILLLVIASGACAPKSTPAPATPSAKQTAAPAPPTPTSNISPVRPDQEAAAWQKIVAAAEKEGKVTAYSYNWVGDIGLGVKKAFESKYHITLEIMTGRGADFTERLKTERRLGQRTGDMTEGSAGFITTMRIEGLLTSVVSELPAMQEKDVWYVSPTYLDPVYKANLLITQQVDTPTINTNLVKPADEPTSWKDLLDPKWKGKMSLREPRLNSILIAEFVALLDKKVWDESYIKAIHKQDLKYIISTVDEARMLSQGEIYMSVLGSGNGMTRFAAQGTPIKAITLKEGEVVSGISMAAIADAPHPNAAKVLLNWLLSADGQSVISQGQSALPVRKDVPDARPTSVRTKMVNPVVITQEQLDDGTNKYMDRWYDKLVGR